MQMTSYLDHNTLSKGETFSDFFFWKSDVMTSRDVILPKTAEKCWKSADVSKNYPAWVYQSSFIWKNIVLASLWGVNHFQGISGSIVVGFLVNGNFCRIFDDDPKKCWRQQKFSDVIWIFGVAFFSRGVGPYPCQISWQMAEWNSDF